MGDCARTRDAQLGRAPRTGETISGPALLGLGRPHTRQRDWDKPRGSGRFKLGHPCCRFQPQHEDFRQHGRAPWLLWRFVGGAVVLVHIMGSETIS